MDEIIKNIEAIYEAGKVFGLIVTSIVALVKAFSSTCNDRESRQHYQKVEYPLDVNEVPNQLRHAKQLIDSASAIRTRSCKRCENLDKMERSLFAEGLVLGIFLSSIDVVFWLESLALIGADINEILIPCAIVVMLFILSALMDLDDKTASGTAWRRIETGFWIGMLCAAGSIQFVVLALIIIGKLGTVSSETASVAASIALLAFVFELLCIFFWHKLIRSHYDAAPFKTGFPFTQTGFQSNLSAGNHCRRVREVCSRKKWGGTDGLLYEQRLLRPHQLNVIDSFMWEGQDVHFLDATIGRPPGQNPEWHFPQVARLERMRYKRNEADLEAKYKKPRQTNEFLDLCHSVGQLPPRRDGAGSETPSDDTRKISQYVEGYLKEYRPRKNDYILCFSHHGICSMLVTLRLLQLGYEHTYDLGECAVRRPLINAKAQELTMLSRLAQEEEPGKILGLGYPPLRIP